MAESSNNVWASIFGKAVDAYSSIEQKRIESKAKAAPSGTPTKQQPNPPPGQFSQYPQADTKYTTGAGSIVSQYGGYAFIAIILMVVVYGFSMIARK